MAATGLHKIPAASFTNFTETLSCPADLEHFNFLIFFSIVLGSTGKNSKGGAMEGPLSITYFSGSSDSLVSILPQVLGL